MPPVLRRGGPSRQRRDTIGLEDLLQAPARDFAAGRKPDAAGLLHVLDDRAQVLARPGRPEM
jgi:hypothetical protein